MGRGMEAFKHTKTLPATLSPEQRAYASELLKGASDEVFGLEGALEVFALMLAEAQRWGHEIEGASPKEYCDDAFMFATLEEMAEGLTGETVS